MTLKKLKNSLLAVLLGATVAGGTAVANPVVIPDFSFENTPLADGTTTGSPNVGTNWLASGNGGVFLNNPLDADFVGTTGSPGTLPAPADGVNCVYMGLAFPGYVWQDLGALRSNTVYTLTVAVGRTLTSNGGLGQIALVNGPNAFGTILAATPIDTTGANPGDFVDYVLVFTTGQQVSGHLTILLNGFQVDSTFQLVFDNVRLDATPTPLTPTTFVPSASPSNTVYVGTAVTLSENPAGAPPFHYQWQSDNGNGGVSFANVSGANNSSYVVDTTGLLAGSSVQYQVVVTNALGASTSGPVVLSIIDGVPVIVQDTLPASGSDVVGSQVTFYAVIDGTRPIGYQWQVDNGLGGGPADIAGATNSSLTLSNLQLTDTGTYTLTASNIFATTVSTGSSFVVNDIPDATNNVLTAVANQTGLGGDTRFTANWAVASGSLIAGAAPSSVGPGDFSEGASGVVAVLTDGATGLLFPAGNGSVDEITGGTVASGAGTSVTYTLPVSATGWDLTNVVTYGGWSDSGRDQQRYGVYYSTVASPTTFNLLANVNFNPFNPLAAQSATRVILTSATSDPLAKNVAAVKFDFTPLDQAVENGFAGYSEFQVFGMHSAPAPVISANTAPVTGSDVEGGSVTFTAAFASSTPITYQWRVDNGSGPVNIPGATNTTLTLSNLQLSDTASPGYSLLAANASGTAASSASAFTVNPAPSPDGNGMLVAQANQTGTGATFTPTWLIASNSLIAGFAPTGLGAGDFVAEAAGGTPVLTDGRFGFVGSGNNSTLATCGSGAGHSLTYTLTGSASGYELTNIVTYGGWSDRGRDEQAYTVYYSTVADPSTYILITSVSYNPPIPGSIPTTDRVTITAPTAPIASHVARVMFDFTTPPVENGYAGYAELAVFGTPSAPIPLAPVLISDTSPVTASDVVGSQVTFTAGIAGDGPISYQWSVDNGSGPVPIPGATSPSLTLSNLQLTDSATPGYSLFASNVLGTLSTTPASLTVNPVPAAVTNIITAIATQTGPGVNQFYPTWTVAPGSLIAGALPSAVGAGNFSVDYASGTIVVLTDGKFGPINPPGSGSPSLVTCGTGGGGQSVTYALTNSASGYNLTNIVVYGGWADNGRDQQHFTISCATAGSPTVFTPMAAVNFNPAIPGSIQSVVRSTLYTASSAPLATNVVSVKVDFTVPMGENGYSGYGEIELFGAAAPSATPPTLNTAVLTGGNLVLTGAGGTPGGSYTVLTSTNLAAPVSTWTTNTTGAFSGTGSYTNTIPVTKSPAARFFRIKTP